jgi:hypothetical protein
MFKIIIFLLIIVTGEGVYFLKIKYLIIFFVSKSNLGVAKWAGLPRLGPSRLSPPKSGAGRANLESHEEYASRVNSNSTHGTTGRRCQK